MDRPKVYLAGPITGLDYHGCTDWREHVKKELERYDIIGLSPMRWKERLKNDNRPMLAGGYYKDVMSCSRGLTTRDRYDCINADLLFVNFLGATQVSIGTAIELGWADANRIPTITVMEPSGNLHEHAMVNELTGFRVATLEEGIDVVKSILVY